MVHRVLVSVAVACSILLVISFALFARDQVSGASAAQVHQLVASPAAPAAPAHHEKGQPRRFIDGAASTLTSPFDQIVSTDSEWVKHGIPTFIALMVFGVGLGYLARFSRGLS